MGRQAIRAGGICYPAPAFLKRFWRSLEGYLCSTGTRFSLLSARSLFRNYPLLPQLFQIGLRVLLKDGNAFCAAEVNPLILVIGVKIFVDLSALDRAGNLCLAYLRLVYQGWGGADHPAPASENARTSAKITMIIILFITLLLETCGSR